MSVFILGVEPAMLPRLFNDPVGGVFDSREEMLAQRAALGRLDAVLFDRSSWPEYGRTRDWALFVGPDESVQVRLCEDVVKAGLQPCVIKPGAKAPGQQG